MDADRSQPTDVDEFLASTTDFLVRHEAENNLLFGICSAIRASAGGLRRRTTYLPPSPMGPAWSWPRACERRPTTRSSRWPTTSPRSTSWPMRCVARPSPACSGRPPRPRGSRSAGPRTTAHAPGSMWPSGSFGSSGSSRRRGRRPAPGGTPRLETGIGSRRGSSRSRRRRPPAAADPRSDGAADRWIGRVGRTAYVWEDGGEVVSLVGAGGETPNGIRIGPVYTPPERRGPRLCDAHSPPPRPRTSSTAGGGSCSCSPTCPTRPRTGSTSRSDTSRCATWTSTASAPMRRAASRPCSWPAARRPSGGAGRELRRESLGATSDR